MYEMFYFLVKNPVLRRKNVRRKEKILLLKKKTDFLEENENFWGESGKIVERNAKFSVKNLCIEEKCQFYGEKTRN